MGSGGNLGGRARPRGSIEKLASGSLRVRVYAGVDVLTGRDLYVKQTIPAGPQAQRRAERARDELLRQVEEGRQPRTNASVSQLLERHLAVAELDRRWSETLRGYLRKHVAPLIGDCPIGSLRAETLDSFYAELRRCLDHCDGRPDATDDRSRPHVCRPASAGTIRHIHYLISGAYENAIRWEWLAVNPMGRARKPAAPRPDPQPPTAEQAAALVTESWRRGIGPLVWVAMTTGARRGELCALRWRDLLVSHATQGSHVCGTSGCRWTLVIRRAIAEAHDGTVWETDTKAHQRRHVALDAETVAVLADHRQECEQIADQLGIELSDEHFIFAATPDGESHHKPSLVSRRFERCAERLKIKTTLHRLRHYSATELITAGVDVRTVAGRLGHYDASTTLKVYAAWVSAADQHASDVLMTRLPQRPTSPAARPAGEPRAPYERVAATLYEAWRSGSLAVGTELTVAAIAQDHGISVGTSHRVINLLAQWGTLRVCTGRASTVLPLRPPSVPPEPAEPISTAINASSSSTPLLRLELLHLGKRIRTMTTEADPQDFPTLRRLLTDAVRRAGGDPKQIGDYELSVHLANQVEPLTTVVIAA